MDTVTSKLERGIQRLNEAGQDTDALGQALLSLHGALEDHFRSHLATNPAVPTEQRQLAQDRQQMQWKQILDLMQECGGLSERERRTIQTMNSYRQKVAHGDGFTGTRSEIEAYAALIQRLTGITISQMPSNSQGDTKKATALAPKPTATPSKLVKAKSDSSDQQRWIKRLWSGQGKPATRWKTLIGSTLAFGLATICYSFALSALRWDMPYSIIGWVFLALTLLLSFFGVRGLIRVLWQLGIKRLLIRIGMVYIIAVIYSSLLIPNNQQGLGHWIASAFNVFQTGVAAISGFGQAMSDAPDSIRFASTGERSAVRVPGVAWEGDIPPTPLSINLIADEAALVTVEEQPTERPAPTEAIQSAGVLQIGSRARINGTDGSALRVREQPESDARIIARLPEQTEVTIIDGPRLNGGRTWWRVRSDTIEGWCVDEFLEPLTNS